MYDHQKRAFLLEKFFELKSIVLVQRAYKAKFKSKTAPTSSTIKYIVRTFRITAQASKIKSQTRAKRVRTESLIDSVKKLTLANPKISIRKVQKDVPGSYETVRQVMRLDLKLKPYKKRKSFKLYQPDRQKRLDFANMLLSSARKRENMHQWLICSDEAYFYLNGGHNIQNDRIWAEFQPNEIVETPLNDAKVMVWCAFSSKSFYGPYFFEETVNWQNYLAMLKNFFWQRHKMVKDSRYFFFQQDGVPPHRKKEVQTWLKSKFGANFLESNVWPPRSPDLNPCDFSLWGTIKQGAYEPKPNNIEELKSNIKREINKFKKSDLISIFENLKKRCYLIVDEKGGHIEHLLK